MTLTPGQIDRMARTRDPVRLEAAADAAEEIGDTGRAEAFRWLAVLERVAAAPRPSEVRAEGLGWEARGERSGVKRDRPFLWVHEDIGPAYRLSRGGWTKVDYVVSQARVARGANTGGEALACRRVRCDPPACAPAVLAALRKALTKESPPC